MTGPVIFITFLWTIGTYALGRALVKSLDSTWESGLTRLIMSIMMGTLIQILLGFCFFIIVVMSTEFSRIVLGWS